MNIRTKNTSRRKLGFTLVELLVSITILSIILFTLAKAIGYVSQLWVNGVGIVDNYTKARNILTVMDRDVQQMVLRPDLAAFVNSNSSSPAAACAFYTNIEGTGTDGRTVSLVQYLLNPLAGTTSAAQTTFGRVNTGMNYTASGTTPLLGTATTPLPVALTQLPTPSTTNTDTLATGVIRFQWQFVDGGANMLTPPYTPTGSAPTVTTPFTYDFTAPSAASNPRAVVVSVLVLNNSAYQLATQNPAIMTKLLSDFPNTLPTTATNQTFSQYWNGILNPATGTLDTSLPVSVRSGLQVFQRYIPLPVAAP